MGEAISRERARHRRRLVAATKQSLRDLRIELAVLNHRAGQRVELKDIDYDCLDVIARHGPLSPTALARRVGVHAATMTGILARLEADGWVERTRARDDRRAVEVRSVPDRQRELLKVFAGMNAAMDDICADFTDEQLATILDFLQRSTAAGHDSAADLA
jgi:DNA-binding MarR family transcriptional regulator